MFSVIFILTDFLVIFEFLSPHISSFLCFVRGSTNDCFVLLICSELIETILFLSFCEMKSNSVLVGKIANYEIQFLLIFFSTSLVPTLLASSCFEL
jgi:hypothetical protein